jgi:nucleotide-binding universal stress UspA family protein
MIFGPSIDGDHSGLDGRMLVCVDGTATSEVALDVAGPWALEFDMEPWVVAVSQEVPAAVGGEQFVESAYPHRMADRLQQAIGREVEYEALHGKHPAKSVAEFAKTYRGGLIVAATHGRTGLDRLTEGSVAMDIVHHAPCPVLLIRPPEEDEES